MFHKTILAVGAIVLMLTPAKAADLNGPPAAPLAVPDMPDYRRATWTGAYIEAGLGLSVGQVDVGVVGEGQLATLSDSAWAGHIGIGYDHMVLPHIVVGILGRAQIDEIGHKVDGAEIASTDITYTAAGRIGWVPRNDAMLYVLGGGSWSGLDFKGEDAPADQKRFGWIVGGGVELMLSDHVGVGLEYTATLYDTEKLTVEDAEAKLDATDHAGRARLLFKF